MKTLKGAVAAGLAFIALCGVAHADLCELTTNDGLGYTHDITDGPNGFRPGWDLIDSASVTISLRDDYDDAEEKAYIFIDPFFLFGGSGSYDFSYSSNVFNLNLFGRLDLQNDGKIDLYVEPVKGDFYLKSSVLNASGKRYASVPEPGTLALFAIGLIGLSLGLRRRGTA
jgi:hypothetical protein